MADTKISALTAATSVALADQFAIVQSGASKSATLSVLRTSIGEGLSAASAAAVAGAYSTDTNPLVGSLLTIPVAGGWQVGSIVKWQFDMTKTAAGTAAATVTVRIGGVALIIFTFGAGTAAIDAGIFDVTVVFRTIGAGTAAVIAGQVRCTHHLAATGLISTGASGVGIILGTSAGFDSTASTQINLSFNGGASFSGTNTYVIASADKL